VRVRDIKDCKVLLSNVSFVWDMTLRRWVTDVSKQNIVPVFKEII